VLSYLTVTNFYLIPHFRLCNNSPVTIKTRVNQKYIRIDMPKNTYEFDSGRREYEIVVESRFKENGPTLDKGLLKLMLSDIDK